GDLFARLGGDEFAVLLHHTGADAASALAGDIVTALSKTPLDWSGIRIPVSTSIGITLARGAGMKAEAVLEAADEALYETKRRGRSGYTFAYGARRTHVSQLVRLDGGMGAEELALAVP
uniref:GGDEF domain-containing protein n=1 Tax=Shinella sumterensis TaxID=1967501 RepID=UPI003F84235A